MFTKAIRLKCSAEYFLPPVTLALASIRPGGTRNPQLEGENNVNGGLWRSRIVEVVYDMRLFKPFRAIYIWRVCGVASVSENSSCLGDEMWKYYGGYLGITPTALTNYKTATRADEYHNFLAIIIIAFVLFKF